VGHDDDAFGRKLRELRNVRGFSLRRLASKTHVSKSRIQAYESGRRANRATAKALDDGLGANGELVALLREDRGHAELLVELTHALEHRGIGGGALTDAEVTCERLDRDFARLGPDETLPQARALLNLVLEQLRRPQSLDHHRRLVTLAGRLSGLRAWASFDINEHAEAERWYQLAIIAAEEAEAWSLGAWLLGAQSLVPWHQRAPRQAALLIERGLYFARQGNDSTVLAWLYGLAARSKACLGDGPGFKAAFAQAEEAAQDSSQHARRHGMDFAGGLLDLRYYGGTSHLLLRRPNQATQALHGSLTALPRTHTKARAVLTLALADAAVQSDDVNTAVGLAHQALASTRHQPILPIMLDARRIRGMIHERAPRAAADLDGHLDDFADALADVASKAER
jgi:transcriptional regulator with XRE-family HTH domain